MKKGKGRIHPTPSGDAAAVLSLLPAAALAAAVGLGDADKEVLAYLVARSMAAAAAGVVPAAGSQHGPAFGCGCFECYTSFWTRWDSSPDREAIHRAIEVYEDHLMATEKRRRRDRKGKKKKGKGEEGELRGDEDVEKKEATVEVKPEEEAEKEKRVVEVEGGDGERRKGWADVMGIFNLRSWNIWSPGD